MPFTTDARQLADTKPLYAVAGCGDLAVQKLREASRILQQVQGRLQHFPTDPQVLQQHVVSYYGSLAHAAGSTYEDLAQRGYTAVDRVRRQESTEELEARAKTTAQQAKAATTSARKTAESAQQAVSEGSDQVG